MNKWSGIKLKIVGNEGNGDAADAPVAAGVHFVRTEFVDKLGMHRLGRGEVGSN